MTCPHGPRPTLPGLCRRLCCIGGSPWCSSIPSPTPGLQGVISEAPAHSSRQTSGVPWLLGHRSAPSRRHTCMQDPGRPPHGVATLPTAKLPPSHTSWRPLAQGQIASPAPPSKMSTLLCSPLLLAKGPTCPPSSETCLGWQFSPALSLPPTPSSMSSSSDYGGYRV